VWRLADSDNDGLVTLPEVRALFRGLAVEACVRLEDVRQHFQMLDVNGDGRLDIEEFVELLRKVGCLFHVVSRFNWNTKKEWTPETNQEDEEPPPPEPVPEQSKECPLCYADFRNPVETPCEHRFCFECINMWFWSHRTCPMCRADLSEWTPPAPQMERQAQRSLSACDWAHRPRRQEEPEPDADQPEEAFWVDSPEAVAVRESELMEQQQEIEQDRILALIPECKAFILRIGHRLMGSTRSNATLYVEPFIPGLPLGCVIQEVLFEFHSSVPRNRRVHARPPLFEVNRPCQQLAPWFKVFVTFKEGLGMEPIAITIHASGASNSSSKSIAVELPELAVGTNSRVRGELNTFRKVLWQGGRRHCSRGAM